MPLHNHSKPNPEVDLQTWIHEHIFDKGSAAAERGTRLVMWITAAMMLVEIVAGWWFNSMALLADGWHMSSHALAIGLSAFAYSAARRYARDPSFAFGTWKIEILAGFASAIFLLGVALLMIFGSVERIFQPQAIAYKEAIAIAVLGLIVNLVCALVLGQAHDHGDGHGHDHGDHHAHHDHGDGHGHDHQEKQDQGDVHHQQHDLNLRSAYIHVIADAATSVLAIIALLGGWFYGWSWLDPVMGLVGAVLVAVWAKNLIKQTARVLLDREMDHPVVEEIREVVRDASAQGLTQLTDLHVWRVGRNAYSCALTVVTHDPALTPKYLREQLGQHEEIVHSTIEIHHRKA
jgi:cation diffusion facilitator family transporter